MVAVQLVQSVLPPPAWQRQHPQPFQTLTPCDLSGAEVEYEYWEYSAWEYLAWEYWAIVACGDVGRIHGVTCAVTGGGAWPSRLHIVQHVSAEVTRLSASV